MILGSSCQTPNLKMQHHLTVSFCKWLIPFLLVSTVISTLTLFANKKPLLEINHSYLSSWTHQTAGGSEAQKLNPTINTRMAKHHMIICPPRATPESLLHDNYQENHISWINSSQETNAQRTTVQLMGFRGKVKICDQIQIRIEARDKMGNIKTYGGDFIRIKLFSKETLSYVNPDYIIDRRNGTYDAFFTLRWPGATHVDATLVHSSEAASVINRFVQNVPNRLVYEGHYKNPRNKRKQITRCDVVVNPQKTYCNYSHPLVFAPWYCVKPRKPLTCSILPKICHDDRQAKRRVIRATTRLEREACERMKMPIGETLVSFNVSGDIRAFQKPTQFCQLTQIPTSMSSQGYFLNNTWHPFHCSLKSFSTNETLSCLKDAHIYLFGDSTARQFVEYFSDHIRGFQNIVKKESEDSLSARREFNLAFNITLNFRCHGLPMKRKCVSMKEFSYVFNELNKLQGGPNVIVLISLWAHFEKTSLYLYEKRIHGILDSVKRLLERSPQTTVIFKGANTPHVDDFFWAIASSDFVAYQFEEKLRSVLLKRNLNVGFLDAWDLTTAHYSPDEIHPNDDIVGTMVNQILTHYCI